MKAMIESELTRVIPDEGETDIVIPEGVTKITRQGDHGALELCCTMNSITFPKSVTHIAHDVFTSPNYTSLSLFGFERLPDRNVVKNYYVAEGNEYYKSVNGALYAIGGFDGDELVRYPAGRHDEHIVIPEGVGKIGCYALNGCTYNGVRTITFPKSLRTIADDLGVVAVANTEFSEFDLGFGKKSLSEVAGIENTLEAFIVEEGNPRIKAFDGVLFDDCGETLLRYPTGKKDKVYRVPGGVTRIFRGAFSQCEYLEEIIIPDSVTLIEDGAFERCYHLKSIKLPAGITEIAPNTFVGCANLETLDIPEGVKEIGCHAFTGCWELKKLHLPESLTTLGAECFGYCTAMVYIPKQIVDIETIRCALGDYEDCAWMQLAGFEVSPDHPTFSTVDGSLFDKDMKTLFYMKGGAEEFAIPDGVERVTKEAAALCEWCIKKLVIPKSVKVFEDIYRVDQADMEDIQYYGEPCFDEEIFKGTSWYNKRHQESCQS